MKRGAFVQFFRQIPWICQGSCQCPSITLQQYHDIFTTTQFPEDLPTCHWNKGFPIQQFAPLLPFLMTLIALSHNLSRECWDSRFRVAYTCWCTKKKKKRERETKGQGRWKYMEDKDNSSACWNFYRKFPFLHLR